VPGAKIVAATLARGRDTNADPPIAVTSTRTVSARVETSAPSAAPGLSRTASMTPMVHAATHITRPPGPMCSDRAP
jgi:hypothetical protein